MLSIDSKSGISKTFFFETLLLAVASQKGREEKCTKKRGVRLQSYQSGRGLEAKPTRFKDLFHLTLRTGASPSRFASSGIYALKPVELPVRAKSRDETFLPWEEIPLCVLMRS